VRVWVVLALLAIATVAMAEDKPRRSRKPDTEWGKPARRCDKGSVQVGQGLCCPRDHSILIDGTCYDHCHSDSDDMILGAWIGCREMCEPGYSSNVNTCTSGALTSERKDHTRDGVAPKAVRPISEITESTISACGKREVKVKGGCCPKSKPKLIGGRCYGGCDGGRDELVIGDFVGCRAACPDGWEQHNNKCTKDHEEDRDRGDFPRESVSRKSRMIIPTPATDKNAGCGYGHVRASAHYCCPSRHPNLKGLLCYANCKTGYEESGYGCRKLCKTGWTQSVLECGKAHKSHRRKGYERHPKPAKLRT